MRFGWLLLASALLAQVKAPTGARPKANPGAKPAPAAKAASAPVLETDDQKAVYALGLSFYQSLQPLHLSAQELDLVKQAIADAAAGKPAEDLATWGPKIQGLAQARVAQALVAQKAASEAYLVKMAAVPGATRTASGMIYRELTAGTGASPTASDTVRVNYRGTLSDGTEFDSSYKRNEPAQFALSGVIRCWTEGLQLMKVGGKATLACPAELAYGDRGRPGIPGGAALTFEIELLGIGAATQ